MAVTKAEIKKSRTGPFHGCWIDGMFCDNYVDICDTVL